MTTRSWIRKLFGLTPSTSTLHGGNSRRKKRASSARKLHVEPLEARLAPAGGLLAELNNGVFHLGDPAENLAITGALPNDTAALHAFFLTSPNGAAAPVTVRGTLDAAGTSITGTFGLREVSATGGVEVTVAGAALQLGSTVGVKLSDADGAVLLLNSGAAARISTEDFSDGVGAEVVGVKGLDLATTEEGLTFAINTTGQSIAHTVATPLGDILISFSTGQPVKHITGPADFRVTGPDGTVIRVGSDVTMTESADGLDLHAEQVSVDLYAGPVRAVALGGAAAEFTLTGDGLALVADSYIVSSFFPLPLGNPVPAGQGNYPEAPFALSANLGPLALEEVSPVLTDLTFGPAGLNVSLGLSATSASLSFAAGEATAEGLTATFGLAGDVDGATGQVTGFSAAGAFSLTADTFTFSVPGVLTASAEGLSLGYDPQATGEQEILRADAVTIDVEALGLTGEFASSETLPALVIRTNGFGFGEGTLRVVREIQVGPVLTITNPFLRLGNFSYTTSAGLSVGSFGLGAEGITVAAPGGQFTATGSDVEASIGFDDSGAVESFTFTAGELTADIAGLVTLSATEVEFTPTATGTDTMLAVSSASATVTVDALSLTGAAGAFTIGADGSITGPDTMSVSLDFSQDPEAPSKFKWPAFLPIQLRTVRLEWPEFSVDPSHFVIGISAGINGQFGPLAVTGGVDNLVIDPYRLRDGEFPIIALDGFAVAAEGNLFGGEISAGMAAGIIKLDDEGNVLDDGATDFASTVFYGGIEGNFVFAGVGGIGLRLGFSELGLHQAYLSANVPGGVLLDPVSGLSLNDFRGGITFNATPLPVPESPTELLAPIFKPTLSLTSEQWREQLKQQVANQASGGSTIFTLEDGVVDAITELESGQVLSGGVLEAAVTENGYAVAEGSPGEATTLEAGALWLVRNQGATYLLELTDAGLLDVTEVLFTLDGALAGALGGGGAIAPELVAAFVEHNIALTNSATVEILEEDGGSPTKWKITDGDYRYFVTVRGNLLAVTGGSGSFDDMNSVLRIEAGATLYSRYISDSAFRADVDLILTTDGKFLIVGKTTLAETVSADIRLFGDLSSLRQQAAEDPLKLVFLADMPSQDSGLPPAVRLQGEMTFEFLDQNGNLVNPIYSDPSAFRFQVLGRAEARATEQFMLVFGGSGGPNGGFASLTLTVEDGPNVDRVQLDVSGSLSIEGVIPAEDLVSAAGSLIFQQPTGGDLEVFGAVKLDFDTSAGGGISLLTNAVLSADAELLLAFNSTLTTREVTLELPGREPETMLLAPVTLALEGEGTLTFGNAIASVGANVSFDGAFSARISVDAIDDPNNPDPTVRGDGGLDLDLFVAGRLDVGLTAAGTDFSLLTLDGLGMIAVRDVGAVVSGQLQTPEVAGRVDLLIDYGVDGVYEAQGSVQMLVNTLGQEFTYVIPDRIQDRLLNIQARREGTDPSQVTLPPLPAVIDPVTGQQSLAVIVPDRPPALLNGEQFAAGPYFVLQFGDLNETTIPGGPRRRRPG